MGEKRGKGSKVKTYSLDQIASVDVQQLKSFNNHRTSFDIVTSGGIGDHKVADENHLDFSIQEFPRVQKLAQTILEARAAFIHGQKPSVEPVGESITDQIGKLAELHKSGILSDDEFSEKKTELLKRL